MRRTACARLSNAVPCNRILCRSKTDTAPSAQTRESLAPTQTCDMSVWPRVTCTRLALTGQLSCLRAGSDPHSEVTMLPQRGFGGQLRKHGWYLCHVATDLVKYLISDFEENWNFDLQLIFQSEERIEKKNFIYIKQKNNT